MNKSRKHGKREIKNEKKKKDAIHHTKKSIKTHTKQGNRKEGKKGKGKTKNE